MTYDNLMTRAHCIDGLNTPEFTQWLGLMRQTDRLRRDLANIQAQGRFVAASEQHGGSAEAIRAEQANVEELTRLVQNAAAAAVQAHEDRKELSALLNPVTSRLFDKGRELRDRKQVLEGDHRGNGLIERARITRDKAIADLVEAGLPRRMANRKAKPSIADIEALEHELAEIPSEIKRNSDLLSTYAGRMELYLAEVANKEAA